MKLTNQTNTLKYHPLLAEKLVALVEKQDQAMSYLALCEQLNIQGLEAEKELQACLTAVEQEGRVVRDKQNNYATPEVLGLYVGKVIGHKDGFGFLQLAKGVKDLFIPHHQLETLLHGDLILAKQSGTDHRGRKECRLVRVLQSRTEPLVGRLFVEHGIAYVMADDSRITQEIIIPNEHKKGARNGQMVVAELMTRPSKRVNATAKIVEVLGEHMAPGMEIEVALRNYDIPHQWPNKLDKELKAFSEQVPEKAKLDRVDLRDLPLVTIDGEDARDFDDAVYCETKRSGGWRLWVAIADVSYYVRPGTTLDDEAQQRGTSVYFPEQVVPMLPEKLSNGLCSLNPQVDRLCMVCEMTVSARGKLSGYKFYQAVINSHARLTYNKVSAILKGDEVLRERYHHLVPHLEDLNQMYASLKQARMERGAIEFETLEPKFVFNAQRKIESVEIVTRNDAHKIIEECMILANVAAAQFIDKHQAQALYRVHDKPDSEKLSQFIQFLAELGISLTLDGDIDPTDFKSVVDKIEGRPDQELIQTMLLRSMKQANYTPDNIGHFGLALKNYAHFTSPIRRYPDLILHRAIKAILLKQNHIPQGSGEHTYNPTEMEDLGDHTSMAERRAETATRDVVNWLKCEFMQDHVGDEFEGVISAVTSFGFFVRINDFFVEGLVHVSTLQSDFYIYDAIKHRLIGEHKRKVYKIGDEVEIKVMSVNLEDKKIDFVLNDLESQSAKPSRPAKYGKRKAKGSKNKKSKTDSHDSSFKPAKKKPSGSKTQQLMAKDNAGKPATDKPKQGKKPKASSKSRKANANKKSTPKANKTKRR